MHSSSINGYWILVLHSHLPYVRHPDYHVFLEESWLNEAILETYLPLIQTFRNLRSDNVNFKITMSFTPTLLSMLEDKYLMKQFEAYIDNLLVLADKEVKRTKEDPHLNYLSQYYLQNFEKTKAMYKELNGNIVSGFIDFIRSGNLEAITAPATHGYLPLMESEPSSVRAQLKNGRRTYKRFFGIDPRGIWLSECGYYKGLENFLADEGIRYFFVDTHGITHAVPRPKFGVHAPVEVGSGVFAFGRDPESSSQVWSATQGYPGDYRYREYYRDIGYDLDWHYIQDHLRISEARHNTGIKYHRITGKSDYKDYYHPDWALEAAGNHAEDFLRNRIAQVKHIFNTEQQRPVIVSPYDAELYGHWWYEGPKFIELLFKKIHYDQNVIMPIHPMNAIAYLPRIQSVQMEHSSWGEKGYSDVWLNDSNAWIYRHLLHASIVMNEQAHKHKNTQNPLMRRVLNQMARELFLAQSSDWAFIMKTGTMVDYAVKRTRIHVNLFLRLSKMAESGTIDENVLVEIEKEHIIFPDTRFEDFI